MLNMPHKWYLFWFWWWWRLIQKLIVKENHSLRYFIFLVLFFPRKFLGKCIKVNIKMKQDKILKQFFYIYCLFVYVFPLELQKGLADKYWLFKLWGISFLYYPMCSFIWECIPSNTEMVITMTMIRPWLEVEIVYS